ncbi:uncharacterized protein [Primulina eburnea]|uniref:uncharacterized protein n=1 Tax=Primulina eburnea TaxID=1245227 RepID=UPI003C6C2B63
MERLKSKPAMLLLWAVLLSQNLLIPVMSAASFEDQKNYYPPSVSYTPPSQGSGGGHATPTPSHGGGSGSSGGSPPANCGTPPSGRHHRTSPSTPGGGGGGGYYHSPPTSTPSPTTPTTPTPGSGTSPTTPIVNPPIVIPGSPSTPGVTTPSPPFSFGPTSPPFTCIFWRNHPTLVWGLIGWLGTVGGPVNGGTIGGTFGLPTVPGFSPNTNVLQALSNTHTDGYGELYREGTAAFLNSMAHARFPYTTTQVRDSFIAALSSNKAASAQGQLFKLANEGRNQPRI